MGKHGFASALTTAILFSGIMVANPFSAVAQEQQQQQSQNVTERGTDDYLQFGPPQSINNSAEPQEEEQNKALVRSFIEEVFNQHNISAVDKYYAPDLVQHNPSVSNGSEAFKQFLTNFFRAFPDLHRTIEHIVAEDDLVMVFLNSTSTGMTAPPRVAELWRIENGMMVEHWDVIGGFGQQ
jgi:predicted SnoaL-like aldol condensation-catalyzing enzyme